MVQNLKGLKTLNIQTVAALTDTSLSYIGRYGATMLHTLLINGASQPHPGHAFFSAGAINELLERCTQLRTLYIHLFNNWLLTATPFVLLPAAIRNLTYLVLRGRAASDENLPVVSTCAVNLQVLRLIRKNESYTHDALAAIVNGCPSLRELYFWPFTCLYLPSYWMHIRPGLHVDFIQNGPDLERDVINMGLM